MKKVCSICYLILILFAWSFNGYAQQEVSMYGDAVKADVKMKYVYSLEEALKLARQQDKPIFFNCFADWALPCHGMNQFVFSDQEFCDYMNEHFINLFMDVTRPEASAIRDKYHIQSYAHFLILNSDGEILLRIIGGKKLPGFKEDVMLALNPKTSLAGTEKIYLSGKCGKKELFNYLKALNLANDHELFKKVAKEYVAMLNPKEYAEGANWMIIRSLITDRSGDFYKYLIEHKSEFEKSVGDKIINVFIERFFYNDIAPYAIGTAVYDAEKLSGLYAEMQKVSLPDTCETYKVYQVAKLRGEKKYGELIDYLQSQGKKLGQIKQFVDNSLEFPDMTVALKSKIIAYLRATAEGEKGAAAKQLVDLANNLEHNEGIIFEKTTFGEALTKAKNENKLLFIDCYTSWCGPCRMMAKQVFTIPQVGAFFNEHFINVKMDMEKGEGKDIAKKYAVVAYPTMMLLDGDGNVVQRILGVRDPKALMSVVSEASNPETGYTASKSAYDKGIRTGVVIKGYTRAMKESGELKDEQIKEIIDNFFAGLDDKQFCDPQNWVLIESEVSDVHSKEFNRILTLHDELVKQNSAEAVNKKIEKIVFPFVLSYLNAKATKEEVTKVLSAISSVQYPEEHTLNLLAKLIPIYHQNDIGKLLDFYEKTVADTENSLDRLNVDLLLRYFMKGATAEQIERAKQYVKSTLQHADKKAMGGYNSLMQALNELKMVG